MEFLIFGDSIAYGVADSNGGWVARLRHYIDEKILVASDDDKYYHEIYNLSIIGENSIGVLSRLDCEVEARLRKYKDCVIIFSLGTNDSQWLLAEKKNKISLEDFEKNIRQLITKAKAFKARIIFVGSLIADDARVNPCPWSPEKAFVTEHIQRYDAAVRRIAEEMSLEYIDIMTPFVADGGTALLDDGIHPTGEGHRVVYEVVRDALINKGLI